MEEIWKPIPGFIDYEASNIGRIRSLKNQNPKILSTFYNSGGYLQVALYQCGRNNLKLVHRLVLWAHKGHPRGRQCDHINRIRDDNRIDNLRWVTRKENLKNTIREMTYEEFAEIQKNKKIEEQNNKNKLHRHL